MVDSAHRLYYWGRAVLQPTTGFIVSLLDTSAALSERVMCGGAQTMDVSMRVIAYVRSARVARRRSMGHFAISPTVSAVFIHLFLVCLFFGQRFLFFSSSEYKYPKEKLRESKEAESELKSGD